MWQPQRRLANLRRVLEVALLSATCLLGRPAGAEPELQLYIPGATYYGPDEGDSWQEESWVWDADQGNELDVWLLGYNQKNVIQNVRISVAVRRDQLDSGGWVKVTWADGVKPDEYPADPPSDLYHDVNEPLPFDMPQSAIHPPVELNYAIDGAGQFVDEDHYKDGYPLLGVPPDTRDMPGHGVYPSPFAELYMGTLDTVNGTDLIWDTQDTPEPPEEEKNPKKTGVIYKLHVEVSGFTCVHFDAHNGDYEPKYDGCFAPFSHDGDGNFGDGVIPEPMSMAFMGSAFAGVVICRLRKRRRKSAATARR